MPPRPRCSSRDEDSSERDSDQVSDSDERLENASDNNDNNSNDTASDDSNKPDEANGGGGAGHGSSKKRKGGFGTRVSFFKRSGTAKHPPGGIFGSQFTNHEITKGWYSSNRPRIINICDCILKKAIREAAPNRITLRQEEEAIAEISRELADFVKKNTLRTTQVRLDRGKDSSIIAMNYMVYRRRIMRKKAKPDLHPKDNQYWEAKVKMIPRTSSGRFQAMGFFPTEKWDTDTSFYESLQQRLQDWAGFRPDDSDEDDALPTLPQAPESRTNFRATVPQTAPPTASSSSAASSSTAASAGSPVSRELQSLQNRQRLLSIEREMIQLQQQEFQLLSQYPR